MDYVDILKKAWRITWRYKALWVLGLFAGAGSGGGSGGSSYRTGSSDASGRGAEVFSGLERWAEQNIAFLLVIAGVLVAVGLVFFVLSIAAQAGLVHAANEAAEERKPSLADAWNVGFSKWGRTFMIGLVLGLPVVALAVVIGLVVAGAGIAGAAAGGGAGAGAALGSICLLLPLLTVLIIAAALIITIAYQLALRYGVLDDLTFGKAIGRAWSDLWAKRGAWVFWLVMLLPGVAFSVVVLLLLLPFAVPAVLLLIAEKYLAAVAVFMVAVLVMMLPSAIWATFSSSAWTVFFRRMTGREPGGPAVATAPAYHPQNPPPVYAPPAAPAPPGYAAPPAVPADAPIVDIPVPPEPPTDG